MAYFMAFMKSIKSCNFLLVEGIKEGDTVVASLHDRGDILGTVLLVSDMPSIKPKQVFVGVGFVSAIQYTIRLFQ